MFNYLNPFKIFKINTRLQKIVFFCFIIVLSIGLIEALFLSPEDYLQKDSVRIMYVHVPAAWISLGIFSSIALLSISVFILKNKNFVLISKSLAPSGILFTLIALVTGSIWGITSMLILFILYSLYLLSFRIFEDQNRANKISSIIAILGAINIPIIKFSVEWWNTLHQPASISLTAKSAIHSSMLIPLIIMTAAFALFSILIFLMKYNTELIKIKNKGLKRL